MEEAKERRLKEEERQALETRRQREAAEAARAINSQSPARGFAAERSGVGAEAGARSSSPDEAPREDGDSRLPFIGFETRPKMIVISALVRLISLILSYYGWLIYDDHYFLYWWTALWPEYTATIMMSLVVYKDIRSFVNSISIVLCLYIPLSLFRNCLEYISIGAPIPVQSMVYYEFLQIIMLLISQSLTTFILIRLIRGDNTILVLALDGSTDFIEQEKRETSRFKLPFVAFESDPKIIALGACVRIILLSVMIYIWYIITADWGFNTSFRDDNFSYSWRWPVLLGMYWPEGLILCVMSFFQYKTRHQFLAMTMLVLIIYFPLSLIRISNIYRYYPTTLSIATGYTLLYIVELLVSHLLSTLILFSGKIGGRGLSLSERKLLK